VDVAMRFRRLILRLRCAALRMTGRYFEDGLARCARAGCPEVNGYLLKKAPPLGRDSSHRGGYLLRVERLPAEGNAFARRDGLF